MSEIEKALEINRLLDIYGRLLTKQQFEIMSDYYYCDLSLSEISELRNISRTAVSDAIKTATKKLDKFEKSVGICGVFDKNRNEKTSEIIDKLEEDLKNGI
ncbi:MAG: hypothetical protein IKP50_04955 [Bacilli bacterium]|nr:hypothetical protein [Bacilli bacterium]